VIFYNYLPAEHKHLGDEAHFRNNATDIFQKQSLLVEWLLELMDS